MKSISLLYGPVLLLLYQTVGVQQDSLGRYRLAFGAAGGQWENAQFACDGSLISATPVEYRSAGVQLDHWPAANVRLTAFGGASDQNLGDTYARDTSYGYPYIEDFAGAFGGVQIAYEGSKLGVGIGLTHVPGESGFLAPAPYLRLGNINGAHFRADAFAPNPAFPTSGWGRMGVGFNRGQLRGTSGFLGLALGPVDFQSKLALNGELGIPMHRGVSGQLQMLVGPGERVTQWNAGAGLRIDFGR